MRTGLLGLLIGALLLAGCSVADVSVADSDLGELLVARGGRTLYLLEQDTDGTSTCYDACAQTWPPLDVPGGASGGEGVDDALLATVERDDGVEQVTYAGHPLYLFSGDVEGGDINGQGSGDVWYVVAPDGSAIRGS